MQQHAHGGTSLIAFFLKITNPTKGYREERAKEYE
jgi:hypothetical protein